MKTQLTNGRIMWYCLFIKIRPIVKKERMCESRHVDRSILKPLTIMLYENMKLLGIEGGTK